MFSQLVDAGMTVVNKLARRLGNRAMPSLKSRGKLIRRVVRNQELTT
jgi:hypothetical protein